MSDWVQTALQLRREGVPFVCVTLATSRGSSPRECGARMLVTPECIHGSVGGGQLEFQATAIAADQLRAPPGKEFEIRTFTLGTDMGQCCGGVVQLCFERSLPGSWLENLWRRQQQRQPAVAVTTVRGREVQRQVYQPGSNDTHEPPDQHLDAFLRGNQSFACYTAHPGENPQWTILERVGMPALEVAIFGAGHVGTALVNVLVPLDCEITWIDSRQDLFPLHDYPNLHCVYAEQPQTYAAELPAGCFVFVMTHSHPLDLEICAAVLGRDDIGCCGLIGSRSKRRQFQRRLRQLGLSPARTDALICPIGAEGIAGKRPAEIAIAVAAQLLQLHQAKNQSRPGDQLLQVQG